MARIGLVLGAGGMAGTAFHAGVLTGLSEALGWDARSAEVMVGTSAGSTSAALLRAGFPPGEYVNRMTGEPLSPEAAQLVAGIPPMIVPDTPPRPSFPAMTSRQLLVDLARKPRRIKPLTLGAALIPPGKVSSQSIADGMQFLHGDGWPHEKLWICAVRMTDGRRVVFGRDKNVHATVGQAVGASCAIPGYFEPILIDGVPYTDGGTHSLCNLDLVRGLDLDLVVVSAPMAIPGAHWPSPSGVLRLHANTQLKNEVAKLRREGVQVLIFRPAKADAEVMGNVMMDASKRGPIATQVCKSVIDQLETAPQELVEPLTIEHGA